MPKRWWDEQLEIAGQATTPTEWLRSVWTQYTDAEVGEILTKARGGEKVTPWAVSKKRQNIGLHKTRSGVPKIFEESQWTRYDDPPRIKTDNLLVMGDVHAPFHHADWCSHAVHVAKGAGIDRVLIAGDLMDFSALSTFIKAMIRKGDASPELGDEIESGADFVEILLSQFEEIDCILGNHEEWLTRKLAVRTRVNVLRHLLGLRDQKRITIHPYFYAIAETSDGQQWRVSHPKNESVIPVRVACRLADKYAMNFIAAHQHSWGEATSVSGRYAADCGCCMDQTRVTYVALKDNLRPKMQLGAWMLVGGRPVLLHPEFRPDLGH